MHTVQPTADVETLVICIEHLARLVREALDQEYLNKQRYCCRLRLDNKINETEREEIKVKLPYDVTCWNTYDATEIESRMLSTIVGLAGDEHYMWYGVRAKLDEYMDPLVNWFIHALDENTDKSAIDFEAIEAEYRKHLKSVTSAQHKQTHEAQQTNHEQGLSSTGEQRGPEETVIFEEHQALASFSQGADSDASSSKQPVLINLCNDDDCIIIDD